MRIHDDLMGYHQIGTTTSVGGTAKTGTNIIYNKQTQEGNRR